MKTYISYVIQDEKEHKHESEILTSQSPPDSYSPDPQISQVMEWADDKRKKLKQNEKLVVVSMFKL